MIDYKKNKTVKIAVLIIILFLFTVLNSACKPVYRQEDANINESGKISEEENFTGIPDSTLISTLPVSGQAIDVDVSGNYAFLTNDLGVLYVVDISDKNNPVVTGKCKEVDSANIVIVIDDYAYISYTDLVFEDNDDYTTNCGFYIVDISDKNNPVLAGNYNTGEKIKKSAYGLFIEGDYAYLETLVEDEKENSGSLEVVDISVKENPFLLGNYDIEGLPSNIYVKDNLAFINVNFYNYDKDEYSDESRLLAIDLKDKKNPRLMGECSVSSNSWSIITVDDYAYLSGWKWDKNTEEYTDSVFQIVNIKNPSRPEIMGEYEIPGGVWEMDYAGNFIYVSSLSGGIYAIDIKDKKNPVIADSLNTAGTTYDITIKGNYGYIADGFEGMGIIELSRKDTAVVEEEYRFIDKEGDKNNPPEAFIEVFGDIFREDYFQVKNPLYFSARKAFDPDGDRLYYRWFINNEECSEEESFSHYFNEPGVYEIKLSVSDGKENSVEIKTIMVTEINMPVSLKAGHDFIVEIEYKLINKGKTDLNEIECYMRLPQTYYPFQVINNYTASHPDTVEVFDNNWNLLLNFKFKDSIGEKESLTASAVIDLTAYEFQYMNIEETSMSFYEKDSDYYKYTGDDLFIDSNSSEIKETAESLTAGETDALAAAEILYNFVIRNLQYDYPRAENGSYELLYASEILKRGRGVCSDYAILYTALLRAAGIPSRLAAGIPVYTTLFEKDREIDMGHAWVEIKLPGYSWMPVDITPEDKFLSPNFYMNIATEKGSGYLYENKTMDWGSYYYDGFIYSRDDSGSVPLPEQEFRFRIKSLDLKDIELD